MAFSWTAFTESGKADNFGKETWPAAIKLAADTFAAFDEYSSGDVKIVEYSTSTNAITKRFLYGYGPPWTSAFQVYDFAICVLSDGRILAAGAAFVELGGNQSSEAYIGTYSGSTISWATATNLPAISTTKPFLLLLSDNRLLLFRDGTYAPYFGTVSGNSISWVLGTGDINSFADQVHVLLSDGRVLYGGGDSHSIGTISGNSVTWVSATDSGSPLSGANPHEALIESGAAIFSSLLGPDARRASISGNTLTHAALLSMGESTAYKLAPFEASDGAYIVLFLADSTEPLGLVGRDGSLVIESDFTISSGSATDFHSKIVLPSVSLIYSGSEAAFVTDDRSFAITSGTEIYFDAWGTVDIVSGTEADFVSANVRSVRFAITSGSNFSPRGATIKPIAARIQGATKVDFVAAFEKPATFNINCGSEVSWVAVFQIPSTFEIVCATSMSMKSQQYSQPEVSISCGSFFVPRLSRISSCTFSISTGISVEWVSDASNIARMDIYSGSACEFVSSAKHVDRQEFPLFAGCH